MGFDGGDTLRSLLSIKIKTRHDSFSDQVSRIIVTKIFILASVVMSIDWFQNELTCIPPSGNTIPDKFISQGCWVRGFYVYPRLSTDEYTGAYYGIPGDLAYNGYLKTAPSTLCNTLKDTKETCVPMAKEHYTQHQWMPFCVSFIGFLLYFPYMVFRVANTDYISLKWNLRNNEVTPEQIVKSYFNRTMNSKRHNRFRTFVNYIVKFLYLINSALSFVFLDWLMNDRFKTYGIEWISWVQNNSTLRYDLNAHGGATPRTRFLPAFAICDLNDVRRDLTHSRGDSIVLLCEIASHVLYQYAFIVFWFVLICAMISSSLGILVYIFGHVCLLYSTTMESDGDKVLYNLMTLRELEYLEFVRKRDLDIYSRILTLLKENVNNNKSSLPLTFHPEEKGLEMKKRPPLRHINSIVENGW